MCFMVDIVFTRRHSYKKFIHKLQKKLSKIEYKIYIFICLFI